MLRAVLVSLALAGAAVPASALRGFSHGARHGGVCRADGMGLCASPEKGTDADGGAEEKASKSMERPALDRAFVKLIEKAEMSRVEGALVENEDGSFSEPLEWADKDSFTQKVSKISQAGPLAMFKQFIADKIAGDFDEKAVSAGIDADIAANPVMMWSFSTCPFCKKAKGVLDAKGVSYKVVECDEVEGGAAIRAMLGRRTGRTSMPSVWVGGEFVGGCNDGGLGGVITLDDKGTLNPMLKKAGALK